VRTKLQNEIDPIRRDWHTFRGSLSRIALHSI